MFSDDLDPENEESTTDEGNEEETQDAATEDKSQQSDDKGEPVDWEARYKGLQRASEKKRLDLEEQLEKAQGNLATTTQMLEEAKGDSGVLEKKQKEALEAKTDLETEVEKLQKEHDRLQKQIDQQSIIMNDFPHLAPVAEFIPAAPDEEGFRDGAKKLSDAINSMVDKGVETSLSGSSPTFEEGDDKELEDMEELDSAWETVYATAGDPERAKEYEAAFERIQKAGQTPDL
jgi:hypothetical protein